MAKSKWLGRRTVRNATIIGALAGTIVAAQAIAAPPTAATPTGWTVSKVDPMTCVANGPKDGEAQLTLAAVGPQFLMLVASPDFPREQSLQEARLAFDDDHPVAAPASGSDGILQIRMGRGKSAWIVVKSTRLDLTVAGKSFRFPLHDAGAALDAVARCAGVKTLAEDPEQPAIPIPGAGMWTMNVRMAGTRNVSAPHGGREIRST